MAGFPEKIGGFQPIVPPQECGLDHLRGFSPICCHMKGLPLFKDDQFRGVVLTTPFEHDAGAHGATGNNGIIRGWRVGG